MPILKSTISALGLRLFFLSAIFMPFATFVNPEAALGMGRTPSQYNVGVRSLAVVTGANERLGVMVWYPSGRSQTEYRTRFGIWSMRAERNVAPARVIAPVILISHDMVDSNIAYHEIAGELAAAGFIVIVPGHTGDNVENASAAYSAAALYNRPQHLLEALSALLAEPAFERRLDTNRIGLLGSGAGALTALQLCGVDLDYGAYAGYCERENDPALCSAWARSRFERIGRDMDEIRARHGRQAFTPDLDNVKAVGVLSPGWLVLANRNEMSTLRVPVAALFAGQGGLYPPVTSAEDVLEIFPRPLYDSLNYEVLREVDHFSLHSECPAEMFGATPEICGRISGKARERLRQKRDDYFVTFFQAALGAPLPLPPDPPQP